jgi:hypothetical protein
MSFVNRANVRMISLVAAKIVTGREEMRGIDADTEPLRLAAAAQDECPKPVLRLRAGMTRHNPLQRSRKKFPPFLAGER